VTISIAAEHEHDALPETRKVERPRLVSRPIPKGWHLYCLHDGGCSAAPQ